MSLVPPLPINPTPNFPLDPLTPDEITLAVSIVKSSQAYKKDKNKAFFDRVELSLPSKASVLSFVPNTPFTRVAYVSIYLPSYDNYYEFWIDLTSHGIASTKLVDKARPAWTYTDNYNLISVTIKDANYQKALKRRGITQQQINNGQVQPNLLIDGRLDNTPCTTNMPNLEGNPRPRAFYASTLLMDGAYDANTLLGNFYVQPVEGIWVWLNANGGQLGSVLSVVDTGVNAPINFGLTNINSPPNAYCNDYRHTLKPIQISQPEGPSFNIVGNLITWERWRFRYSMHPTVGLVLNLIEYNDVKNQTDPPNYRSVLYQANISEAITAYGSDEYGVRNFNFLDFGEYQTRLFMTPLQPGIDVPPYASMFNPVFADDTGSLLQWENGLAIYEEDAGMLWRHYEYNTFVVQGRRARNLVLAHCNCIGNYDYTFYWKFGLDGSIKCDVQLSGMDEMAGGTVATETATRIQQNLIASNHEHFFNFRFDFMVDGQLNRVTELNAVSIPTSCNNAWTEQETLLHTTAEATRNINPLTARAWVFQNNQVNPSLLGHKPGYVLASGDGISRMASDASRISKRAPFMDNNLFVTTYRENEQYFMGKYPVEKGTCEGIILPDRNNDNIVDKDIVAWFTIGFAHAPEVENFPVLNAETLSVKLVPSNFFGQNPAMDVDINTLI